MRWNLKSVNKTQIVDNLAKQLNVNTVIAKLLVLRGITTFDEAKDFFCPDLKNLHNPYLMKDMEKAVSRILKAIETKEKILVYGDYDVDGTTSVALMSSFLKTIHPNHIEIYIPDRYKEGYGVSTQGIDFAHENNFSLIIALDCGIKSVDKVNYAKELGIDFIICDHHLPGTEIPEAIAVLDPKQEDCPYPYKELCGCGVGFKLIQAIAEKKQIPFEYIIPYLDLVAIAIGADIVPITGENRILAYFGLNVIASTNRPGLLALKEQFSMDKLSITDVVFKIAPRINAAGRIKHGTYAVKLLTELNKQQAIDFLAQINSFNDERKSLDQKITSEALQQIVSNQEENKASTVVYQPNWHKGVIGIVASRLIENYYRPTIVFTCKDNETLVASARSIKNFDLYAALEACSEHLEQFGGHMYAAGMTLKKENYEIFKQKFEEYVVKNITEDQKTPEIEIDDIVSFDFFNEKRLNILERFEPHGPGNMHPVFLIKNISTHFTVKQIGRENKHLKFIFSNNQPQYKLEGVAFSLGHFYPSILENTFHIAFSLSKNEWNGNITHQLMIKDITFENYNNA